jgi:AcrR family transcriptional regulator
VTSSKRELILGCMLDSVGAHGYEATSVQSVLDRAGLYRQAFYDDFASKEDCFLQAYRAGIERVEATAAAAASAAADWQGQLRAGLGALLALLDAEPDFGRALVVEVHAAGGPVLDLRAEAMTRACAFLDRPRGEKPAEAPRIAPEAIAFGIHTVLHGRLAAHEDGAFSPLLGELMYVAVLPYYGVETARGELGSEAR